MNRMQRAIVHRYFEESEKLIGLMAYLKELDKRSPPASIDEILSVHIECTQCLENLTSWNAGVNKVFAEVDKELVGELAAVRKKLERYAKK